MPHRYLWRRARHFVVHRVLRVDDTPHRIAMGVAVGLFVAWTPTMGVQMILAFAVAALLRANKAIAVALVWLTNPFTMLPVYYINWFVGRTIVPTTDHLALTEAYIRLGELARHSQSWFELLGKLGHPTFWKSLARIFLELGFDLWVGSFVLGAVLAVLGYFTTVHTVISYRQRRSRRREPSALSGPSGFGDASTPAQEELVPTPADESEVQ